MKFLKMRKNKNVNNVKVKWRFPKRVDRVRSRYQSQCASGGHGWHGDETRRSKKKWQNVKGKTKMNLESCESMIRDTRNQHWTSHDTITVSAAQTFINRPSHSLITDSPQIHEFADSHSFTSVQIPPQTPHGTPWECPLLPTLSWNSECWQVSTPSSPGYSMDADRSPYQTLHGPPWMLPGSTRVQSRQKLCCPEACREHHETRRDVVSGQTEGNSARVAEDVLRIGGFSHKTVQAHQ